MANHPTIVVSKGGVYYKICKVWFGADGSYYVTMPYHPARRALFMKMTVDYTTRGPQYIRHDDALEVAILDDDEARPKLSHHPDGFCQFSGKNVISGKDEKGKPKGIAVFASPLMQVGRGPAFSIVVRGVEAFDKQDKPRSGDITFAYEEMNAVPKMNALILEGYYFQPLCRRFIRTLPDGTKSITVVHPSGIALPLRVLLPDDTCELPGFLGLEMYAFPCGDIKPGFTMSGPGEKSRTNELGHLVADVIMGVFPAIEGLPYRCDITFKPPEPATSPAPTSTAVTPVHLPPDALVPPTSDTSIV
jgi:hypothetical protein